MCGSKIYLRGTYDTFQSVIADEFVPGHKFRVKISRINAVLA